MVTIGKNIWGYSVSLVESDDIIAMLDKQVADAIAAYRFIAVERDDALNNPGFARVSARVPISADLFDHFFNSRSGYRAQYFHSVAAGERYNRYAVDIIAGHIQKNPHLLSQGVSAELCRLSLQGMHTKVWFPKEIKDRKFHRGVGS